MIIASKNLETQSIKKSRDTKHHNKITPLMIEVHGPSPFYGQEQIQAKLIINRRPREQETHSKDALQKR